MTEKELLGVVRDLARLRGWRAYHTHRSQRSEPGFPDLVLVRGGRLIFAELKSDEGRPTREQNDWLIDLGRVGLPVESHLWKPGAWRDGTIDRCLA